MSYSELLSPCRISWNSNAYYYLAYGSNINIFHMKRLCPTAEVLGTCMIPNSSLEFRGDMSNGFWLDLVPSDSSSIPVVIWKMSEISLKTLDDYEGCPSMYIKKTLPITYTGLHSTKKTEATAFYYKMRDNFIFGNPTGKYFKLCLEGYSIFGFDPKPLYDAREKVI